MSKLDENICEKCQFDINRIKFKFFQIVNNYFNWYKRLENIQKVNENRNTKLNDSVAYKYTKNLINKFAVIF